VSGAVSLSQSGLITWATNAFTDWASTSINGTAAFYVRFSLSAALDSAVQISEIRCLIAGSDVSEVFTTLYRGRPARSDDPRPQSVVWEPYGYIQRTALPTASLVVNNLYPYSRGGALIVAGKQYVTFCRLSLSALEHGLQEEDGFGSGVAAVFSARHDGGMPEVNKQWTRAVVKGKTIDSNHTADFNYRTNEATAFTAPSSATASSSPTVFTLSSVTGYSFQWKLLFNSFAHDLFTEVNEVEVVFRELPTYKNDYTFLIELSDGTGTPDGGVLPDASVQLTALEALQGSSVALIDPAGRSETVTVRGIKTVEALQSALDYPILVVEVKAAEV
jgi:hypothetical protein